MHATSHTTPDSDAPADIQPGDLLTAYGQTRSVTTCPLRLARREMTGTGEIIAAMVQDLRDAPELAAQAPPIDREFFLNRGWSRHQVTAWAPRAIEAFRQQ